MDRMIYTALSGMDAAMTRQRVTASNLANASTPGFRAEEFAATPTTATGDGLQTRAFSRGAAHGADMRQGRVVPTGRDLDIAVKGDALIALQALDGAEVYSRRGDLSVGPGGVLANGDGLPVMGDAGPITVPSGRSLSIAKDGAIFASDPGAPNAEPEEIARIKLASPEGSRIAKDLDGFLRVAGGGILPADAEAQVTSGALEQSNVDSASTLVDMIEAQRAFEQRAKLMSTVQELDQSGARLMSLRQ